MKLLILLLSVSLYALTPMQKQNLEIAYNIGKQIKAIDGFNFGETLCAIMLQESSAGKELIGDKYKNGKLKSLYDSSLGVFQIKLDTVKEVIKKDPYIHKNFKHLKSDKQIINLLLTSTEFSALIAVTYLKMNYNIAYKRNYKNPWHSSISRYNGGWKNTKYKNKIFNRLKYLRKNYLKEK